VSGEKLRCDRTGVEPAPFTWLVLPAVGVVLPSIDRVGVVWVGVVWVGVVWVGDRVTSGLAELLVGEEKVRWSSGVGFIDVSSMPSSKC